MIIFTFSSKNLFHSSIWRLVQLKTSNCCRSLSWLPFALDFRSYSSYKLFSRKLKNFDSREKKFSFGEFWRKVGHFKTFVIEHFRDHLWDHSVDADDVQSMNDVVNVVNVVVWKPCLSLSVCQAMSKPWLTLNLARTWIDDAGKGTN